MNRGKGNADAILILAVLIVIMIIAPKAAPNSKTNPPSSRDANYTQNIYLSSGNASYTYQPYEEYITIYNSGSESVNITGWQLRNGKDERAYNLGGSLRHFPADIATIGQAALFISPTGNNALQNIVLKSSEQAIITTGKIGPQLPYKIISFKENICSGYRFVNRTQSNIKKSIQFFVGIFSRTLGNI